MKHKYCHRVSTWAFLHHLPLNLVLMIAKPDRMLTKQNVVIQRI